jgi:O-antigen ligase
MKRLWLFCFPLLFVPNGGFSHRTTFGVLEVSDWLIAPFIVLLVMVPSAKYEQRVSKLIPILWSFAAWALLSTLSIHFRYEYLDDVPILLGSLLKLARLVLYVSAGILVARKLSDPKVRWEWLWSLLAALLMLSMGLLASSRGQGPQPTDALQGYKSYNVMIVSLAILTSYIAGLWLENAGGRRWSQSAGIVIAVALCSVLISTSLSSHGRGGWLALAAGFGYILCKRDHAFKTLAIIVVFGLLFLAGYETLPNLRSLVDLTVSPSENGQSQSVDDGARISTWAHEAPKFVNAPLLGTGFYHRGGTTTLWDTGSHNFFLQMFLETGLVGGSLLLLAFALGWRQAGLTGTSRNRIGIPTRAALITAIVGGMSGEYYYGGIGVFTLAAVFAIAGSLPAVEAGSGPGTLAQEIMRRRRLAL